MMICLGVFFFGSNFFGTLWTSWKSISFLRWGMFSFIICSNKFLISCFCSSPFDTPIIRILECFRLSQRFLSHASFFWILFFLKFLLLFNYSCMPFLPIPPPHSSWTHLPPPPPPPPWLCPCVLYSSSWGLYIFGTINLLSSLLLCCSKIGLEAKNKSTT